MPHYRKSGKIQEPITDNQFVEKMKYAHFMEKRHIGFVVLLWYFAIRKMEALRTTKEQFRITDTDFVFEVGPRLKKLRRKQKDPQTGEIVELDDAAYKRLLRKRKHEFSTPPLTVSLDAPYVGELVHCVETTKAGHHVWEFCPKTAYNIVQRAGFNYPHFFRLSRITNFFLDGWTIAQVRAWTGLTLAALEHYVGMVDVIKMGRSLGKKRGPSLEQILREIQKLPPNQQEIVTQRILELAGKHQ